MRKLPLKRRSLRFLLAVQTCQLHPTKNKNPRLKTQKLLRKDNGTKACSECGGKLALIVDLLCTFLLFAQETYLLSCEVADNPEHIWLQSAHVDIIRGFSFFFFWKTITMKQVDWISNSNPLVSHCCFVCDKTTCQVWSLSVCSQNTQVWLYCV